MEFALNDIMLLLLFYKLSLFVSFPSLMDCFVISRAVWKDVSNWSSNCSIN